MEFLGRPRTYKCKCCGKTFKINGEDWGWTLTGGQDDNYRLYFCTYTCMRKFEKPRLEKYRKEISRDFIVERVSTKSIKPRPVEEPKGCTGCRYRYLHKGEANLTNAKGKATCRPNYNYCMWGMLYKRLYNKNFTEAVPEWCPLEDKNKKSQ